MTSRMALFFTSPSPPRPSQCRPRPPICPCATKNLCPSRPLAKGGWPIWRASSRGRCRGARPCAFWMGRETAVSIACCTPARRWSCSRVFNWRNRWCGKRSAAPRCGRSGKRPCGKIGWWGVVWRCWRCCWWSRRRLFRPPFGSSSCPPLWGAGCLSAVPLAEELF